VPLSTVVRIRPPLVTMFDVTRLVELSGLRLEIT
jgi:hypothetical protein